MTRHDERLKSRKEVPEKTLVIQCIDCTNVIGTEKGHLPQTETCWSLCGRCIAKRNGLVGARSVKELGIY